jgi:hypothetical protein
MSVCAVRQFYNSFCYGKSPFLCETPWDYQAEQRAASVAPADTLAVGDYKFDVLGRDGEWRCVPRLPPG